MSQGPPKERLPLVEALEAQFSPHQLFSKSSLQTRCVGIAKEVVRKSSSWALPLDLLN